MRSNKLSLDPLVVQVGVVACLLVMTDIVMLFSSKPLLYGVTNAYSTRFEESLLYLPIAVGFDVFEPFRNAFTGPGDLARFAPFPLVSFTFMKLCYWLGFGNLNATVVFLHLVAWLDLLAAVVALRALGVGRGCAVATGFLMVFGFDFARAVLAHTSAGSGFYALFVVAAAATMVVASLRITVPLLGVGAGLGAAYVFTTITQSLLGFPFYSEISATRFLSPSIPFFFLFLTIAALAKTDRTLMDPHAQVNEAARWCQLTLVLLAANLLVYFANWLILVPVGGLWFLWRFGRILRALSVAPIGSLVAVVLFFACSATFCYGLFLSKTDPAIMDYVQRAGNFGIRLYRRFNYPPLYGLIVNGFFLLGFFFLLRAARRSGRTFCEFIPWLAYASCIGFSYLNYLKADTIPQALLLHRYWIPLILMNAAVWLSVGSANVLAERLERYFRGAGVLMLATFMLAVMCIGRLNLHTNVFSEDNVQVTRFHQALSSVLRDDEIMVTDWHEAALMAPSYRVRTFLPNPIISPVSHKELARILAFDSYILGRSEDEYLEHIGNLDTYGPVHMKNNSITTALVQSQNKGVAYPFPSTWVESERDWLRQLYSGIEMAAIKESYPKIMVCLRDRNRSDELGLEMVAKVMEFDDVVCHRL